MNIQLDETIAVEFESWSLSKAREVIDHVREKHRERGDSVLRALTTLLLLSQVEKKQPGTMALMLDHVTTAAGAMSGPAK